MPAAAFFERLRGAARDCGVTRLADITGLDRLGLPVWQAVRPAGKALSVHQGKGGTALAARIGALAEAIESHCAENAPADGPSCPFDALDVRERAAQPGDFARSREAPPPAGSVQWCRAEDALSGSLLWLPHDIVSLDFEAHGMSWFDRSSTGLGLGATVDEAMETSLCELVERDSVGAWRRLPTATRMARAVDVASVSYGWFGVWCERLERLGIELRLFALEGIGRAPVVVCWIGGEEAFGRRYRSFAGSACHAEPERALFKALAEALQSRLTLIAGVRDDILPSTYERRHPPLPEIAGEGLSWADVPHGATGWQVMAEVLAALGFRTAVKRLDRGLDGIAVTKMFAPGLGSLTRTRRAAR